MLIDGRAMGAELKETLRAELEELGRPAGIATLLVGDDLAAQVYQRRIDKNAHELGLVSRPEQMPGDATLGQVIGKIAELDADPDIDGILVLRPLPPHLPESRVFNALPVLKDVEALHPTNAGLLSLGIPRFIPSTPAAAFHMLDAHTRAMGRDPAVAYDGADTRARRALEQRRQAGRDPRAAAQRDRHLRPQAHRGRRAPGRAHPRADILIVAVGVPHLITGDMVKEGAIIIDIGINAQEGPDGKVRPDRRRGHRVGRAGRRGDLARAGRRRARSPTPGSCATRCTPRGSTSRLRDDRDARRPLRHLRLRARADPHRRDGAPGARCGRGARPRRRLRREPDGLEVAPRGRPGRHGERLRLGRPQPGRRRDHRGDRARAWTTTASASPSGSGSASGSGRWGRAAQYIVLPERQAVPLPDHATLDMGAGLGIPAMTAHRCLFADGSIDGASILVHGGAGAVGHAAIQLAARAGARVAATVSSPEKARIAQEAGAGLVVNYREEDVVDVAARLGAARDRPGRRGRHLGEPGDRRRGARALRDDRLLRRAGRPAAAVARAHHEERAPRLVLVYTMPDEAKHDAVVEITHALEEDDLQPLPTTRFPLEEAQAAHEAVQGGSSGRCSSTSRRSPTRHDRRGLAFGRRCVARRHNARSPRQRS